MKNITLLFMLFGFGLAVSFSQSTRSIDKGEWIIGAGVNTINSQGSKVPYRSISDWSFRYPIIVSAETYLTRLFSVELAASLNGYKAGDNIDAAGPSDDDLTYFAADANLKYYFGDKILPTTDWLDLYALAGLGYFVIDDSDLSTNLGGGAMFWLDSNKSTGIKLQAVGKLAFNHSNFGKSYANNHIQFSLMFLFRL